jgi:hypothetical protein
MMSLPVHLLIYYLSLSILLYGSLAYNPRMWLHRMPPEVVAKAPPKTPEEKRLLLKTVGIPFLLLLVVYPIKFTPRFIIINGTEREDYSNMKYHLVSGAKGIVLSVAFSGILATLLFFIKDRLA